MSEDDPDQYKSPEAFWHELIDIGEAANFVSLSVRTLQAFRSRGGGPAYVRISSRCVKYRRTDLRLWADSRLRKSTSEETE